MNENGNIHIALEEYQIEEELTKTKVLMSRPEFARVMEMLTESKYIVARIENVQKRSDMHMIAIPVTYFLLPRRVKYL